MRVLSAFSLSCSIATIASLLVAACSAAPDSSSSSSSGAGNAPDEAKVHSDLVLRKFCSSDRQCGGTVPYCCTAEAICVGKLTSACYAPPPPPPPIAIATAIALNQNATGEDSGCLLTSSGAVECWGGASATLPYALTPIPLAAPAVSIASGWGFGCAALSNATVWCWGPNDPTGATIAPTQVMIAPSTPLLATSVSAGFRHVCAVTVGGGAMCWGLNYDGQLGTGFESTGSAAPVAVVGLNGTVTSIAAGYEHTCALLSGGAVQCWGADDFGQLGVGGLLYSPSLGTPQLVSTLPSATSISAGSETTCALTGSGAYCWGSNTSGQEGIGTSGSAVVGLPALVQSPPGSITQVVAGAGANFEIVGGLAYAAGANTKSDLGANPATNVLPVPLLATGDSFSAIASGYSATCGITAGHVECVGIGSATPVTIY